MSLEIARLFRDLRRLLALSPREAAELLRTSEATIAALEEGRIEDLPDWPETVRVIDTYTALAALDAKPVLAVIRTELDRRSRTGGGPAAHTGPRPAASSSSSPAAGWLPPVFPLPDTALPTGSEPAGSLRAAPPGAHAGRGFEPPWRRDDAFAPAASPPPGRQTGLGAESGSPKPFPAAPLNLAPESPAPASRPPVRPVSSLPAAEQTHRPPPSRLSGRRGLAAALAEVQGAGISASPDAVLTSGRGATAKSAVPAVQERTEDEEDHSADAGGNRRYRSIFFIRFPRLPEPLLGSLPGARLIVPALIAVVGFGVFVAQPAAVHKAASMLPAPVSRGLRDMHDAVMIRLAPRRHGLVWIEVDDPRLRRSDKLPMPAR